MRIECRSGYPRRYSPEGTVSVEADVVFKAKILGYSMLFEKARLVLINNTPQSNRSQKSESIEVNQSCEFELLVCRKHIMRSNFKS